ncbi:MAG: LuxR C-terminal-related transcriptional regulator [Gammaproteobacteria bacterium]
MINQQINIYVQLPSFIFWKDTNSIFLGCNSHFSEVAGLNSTDQIVGKTDFDLAWGETHADLYRQGDCEVLSGISKTGVVESQLQSNGKISNIVISKVPLLDSHNQTIGILGNYVELRCIEEHGEFLVNNQNISLTKKQSECLYYLAKGLSNKQIGNEMDISTRTVESHVEILKNKLNCYNKVSLVQKALTIQFINHKLFNK